MQAFNLVDTDEILNLSRKHFLIKFHYVRDQIQKYIVDSKLPHLQRLFKKTLDFSLTDNPNLRHWTNVSIGLIKSIKLDHDPMPSSSAHFFVDKIDEDRIFELHVLKYFELVACCLIDENQSFSWSFECSPSKNFTFSNFATTFTCDSYLEILKFEISFDSQKLKFKSDTTCWAFDTKSNLFSGPSNIKCNMGIRDPYYSLPIHDDSICGPYYANAPILRGLSAVHTWHWSLQSGINFLKALDADVANDCLRLSCQILPLHNNSIRYGSASCEDLLGLIYLPAVTSEFDLAECLLHESMHQKLFRLEEMISIFEDGTSHSDEKYYSPWRSDARPLRMCLHGAYVFAGISEMWIQAEENSSSLDLDKVFCKKQAYLRAKQSLKALEIVSKYSHLTEFGKDFVESLNVICNSVIEKLDTKFQDLDQDLKNHEEKYASYIS